MFRIARSTNRPIDGFGRSAIRANPPTSLSKSPADTRPARHRRSRSAGFLESRQSLMVEPSPARLWTATASRAQVVWSRTENHRPGHSATVGIDSRNAVITSRRPHRFDPAQSTASNLGKGFASPGTDHSERQHVRRSPIRAGHLEPRPRQLARRPSPRHRHLWVAEWAAWSRQLILISACQRRLAGVAPATL